MLTTRQFLVFATQVFIVAILAFAALQFEYFSWDLTVTRWLQSFRNPALRQWLHFVSWIGQGAERNITLYAITVAAFLLFRLKREAVFLALTPGIAHSLSGTFKVLIARPRPTSSLIEVLIDHGSKSFPSGHVLSYVGFYGLLIYLSFRLVAETRWRIFFTTVFGLMILSVGPSRVYVGAHWPSDVLGGYLLGGAWLMLAIALYRRGKKVG